MIEANHPIYFAMHQRKSLNPMDSPYSRQLVIIKRKSGSDRDIPNYDYHKEEDTEKPETHPTCGDDRVLENVAAQLAAQFHRRLLGEHLGLLRTSAAASARSSFSPRVVRCGLALAHLPCPPPPRGERRWSAGTCWIPSGAIGPRWPSPTSEGCRLEAGGAPGVKCSLCMQRAQSKSQTLLQNKRYLDNSSKGMTATDSFLQ